MITRLYLNNCFTHHDQTFTFEKGLTGIIGPNESGKSLIVEMIRYALFGSKALRGKSEDYKKLHVELDFVVGDATYTVIRKGVKTTLTGPGHEVTGTKPVDEAIREILGYDLHVFDVANSCNQGNVEALSDMTPANRKAMVDKTVGLTVLDDLITFAGQEGNALKREAEGLSRGVVQPVAPEQPEGYRPSAEITLPMEDQREYHELVGFLSRVPAEPTMPGPIEVMESAAELEKHQDDRKTVERSINHLRSQRDRIEPEEWAEADLDGIEKQHDAFDAWRQKERLLAQGHICCPECNHTWPVADLGDLADVEPAEQPEMTRRELQAHRARIGNGAEVEDLDRRIFELEEGFSEMPDRADDLALVNAHKASMQIYRNQKGAWDKYNADLPAKAARFEELKGIDETVAALQAELEQAKQYERERDRFVQDTEAYEKRIMEIQDVVTRSEEFLKAREIIKALKTSVKSHLLPSLNKVASVLLSQMTGGERSLVEVDEDFEITIDGQRIATLSGSGKAVANLAIRIALGQILTNRVFSIFLADEVDASMDDDRADYTAQALRRLTERVSQVMTVTHKRPETDYTIELKK